MQETAFVRADQLLTCSYCGKKLSEIDLVMIGCCPLCKECYEAITRAR
ncbi:hypothetical protein [Archaeoglobus sulfaticallidus]|nr:hypothetical protein [Archaeoglobus sulfaticallidus]